MSLICDSVIVSCITIRIVIIHEYLGTNLNVLTCDGHLDSGVVTLHELCGAIASIF